MKLYSADLSPFAARVRVQLYAKGLDVPLAEAPDGLGSVAYRRINPTGKVPALLVDGVAIPESDAIGEFLEDRFPEPPLRPTHDLARARMRAIQRWNDNEIVPRLSALFPHFDPRVRDAAVVRENLEALAPALDKLEALLAAGPFAAGPHLTLADCSLFPTFFFATRLFPILGAASPVTGRFRLASWWERVQDHPAVRRVNGELEKALAEFMAAP